MRNLLKKMTFEDRFARHYYCNSYRFIHTIKRANHKAFRKMLKTEVNKEW